MNDLPSLLAWAAETDAPAKVAEDLGIDADLVRAVLRSLAEKVAVATRGSAGPGGDGRVVICGRRFRLGARYEMATGYRSGRRSGPKLLRSFDPAASADLGGRVVAVTRGGTPSYYAGRVWAQRAGRELSDD